MNLVYSFIGILPSYIIESIYQARLFFDGDIYLIIDDYESSYLKILKEKFNVKIFDYQIYRDEIFIDAFNSKIKNFESPYLDKLEGRELLFIRSYERLFLVNNLIKKLNLKDTLTLELDNLIYSNPELLLEDFRKSGEYTAMASFDKHYCIGYMYIKHNLDKITKFLLEFIYDTDDIYRKTYGKITEMKAIYAYQKKYNDLYLLPIIYNRDDINIDCYVNYNLSEITFNNSLFDSAGHGINMIGKDKYHNIILDYYYINETDKTIKYNWKKDEKGLMKPYIYDINKNKWILINNLHIHSKKLNEGLSKPLEL